MGNLEDTFAAIDMIVNNTSKQFQTMRDVQRIAPLRILFAVAAPLHGAAGPA